MNKKRKYKIVKKVLALTLAGTMAASFVGCSKLPKGKAESKIINLSNEEEELSVIGIVESGVAQSHELYGYFMDNNTKFYDVLNNEEINFSDFDDCDIYYTNFKNILSDKDCEKFIDLGYMYESQIKYIDSGVSFGLIPTLGYYTIGNRSNDIFYWYQINQEPEKFTKLEFEDDKKVECTCHTSKEMNMR